MQNVFCQSLLDPGVQTPPGLTVWNGSDPAVRFAVYRNNVIASLTDVLAENCPVLVQQVGEAYFRAMAAEFIRQNPPASAVLSGYGSELPAWLRAFPPLADWPWLGELARLELLFIESLHAAEGEHQRENLRLPDCDPALISVRLHPSVRVMHSSFAVFSLWAAHQREGVLDRVDPWQAEQMLLFRSEDDVRIVPVSRAEAKCIEMRHSGHTLADAISSSVEQDVAFDPSSLLQRLHWHGLLLSLFCPEEK